MALLARNEPACSAESATRWCLEHLDAFEAVLVGVESGAEAADFHIVPLLADDLISDVAALTIPSSWQTLVVVTDGPLLGAQPGTRIGLGVDRSGATHVECRPGHRPRHNHTEGGR